MIKINLNQIALGNRKTIVRIVGIADEIILMKKKWAKQFCPEYLSLSFMIKFMILCILVYLRL